MKRTNHLLLWIVLLTGGALAGCATNPKPLGPSNSLAAGVSTSPTPRPAVEVFEIKSIAAAGEQLIPAVISTEHTAVVLAQREGVLIELRSEEGARVAKGQELARLSDDDLRVQLHQAELDVSRLKLEERQLEALVKVNRTELDQEQALAQDGLTSQRQLDRARFKLEGATQELEKARLNTQTAQSRIESVKIEIERSIVRAPFAGIITRRYAKLGSNMVRSEKLFEVSQLTPLEVKFQIPEVELTRLGPGSLVKLSLNRSDQTVAQARIRRLDPVADAASNSLSYLADVTSGAGLIPGQAVYVRIPRVAAAATFWIPRAALPTKTDLRPGVESTLLLLDGETVRVRTVRVGAVEGDQVEISSGLAAGDRVILAPLAGLKEGDVMSAAKN